MSYPIKSGQQSGPIPSIIEHDYKNETSVDPVEINTTSSRNAKNGPRDEYYKPTALRTPYLVAFSILIIFIFTALQIGAAAFSGAPGLENLRLSPSPSSDVDNGFNGDPNYTSDPSYTSDPNYVPDPSQTTGIDYTFETTALPEPSQIVDPIFQTEATNFPGPTQETELITSVEPSPTVLRRQATVSTSADASTSSGIIVGKPPTENYSSSSNGWKYFLGAYVPTLASLIIGIWWKCIYARLKEMEPFYQMTRSQGAKAGNSLLLSYPRATLVYVFFKSLFSRHTLTFLGTVNALLITICTTLASLTLFTEAFGDSCKDVDGINTKAAENCQLRLAMHPAFAWILSGVLLVIFISTGYITMQIRRRVSGIYIDPTSVAGSATLCNDELANMSTRSLKKDHRAYVVAPSRRADVHPSLEATTSSTQLDNGDAFASTEWETQTHDPFSMRLSLLVLFWLFLAGIVAMVSYYCFVSKPGTGDKLEDFMNSKSKAVRIFMTLLGLAVKFYWGWIEDYVRTTRPFLALTSPTGADAKHSVLLGSPSSPVTALFHAETWGSMLLGVVTLMAVLSEVLVVTLNTVPFKAETTAIAASVSMYISIIILVLMLITLTAVMVWKVRVQKKIPSYPECMADVFQLLSDMEGREALRALCEGRSSGALPQGSEKFALQEMLVAEPNVYRWRVVKVTGT